MSFCGDALKGVNREIPSAKRIELNKSDNSVRSYIRIWPCMRVYEKIRLHTWMWYYNRVVGRKDYRWRSQRDRESSI